MRIFIIVFSLVISFFGFAQSTELFYSVNTTNGLSSSSVTSIVQDNLGCIWLGTKNGLNRYNGSEIQIFNTQNSNLTSNDISALYFHSDQLLIIGTVDGGLFIKKSGWIKPLKDSMNLIGERIIEIKSYQEDQVFIISENGAFVLTIEKGLVVAQEPIIPKNLKPYTIIESAKGDYWVGTSNGCLLRYNSQFVLNESYCINEEPFSGDIIFSLNENQEGKILVGTKNEGLLLFDPANEGFQKTAIDNTIVRDIHETSTGELWIASDGNGLYSKSEGGSFVEHIHINGSNSSIASNATYTVFEDLQSNLWVGTAWNGVSVLDRHSKNFEFYYSDFEGEEANGVLSIYVENDEILFGADGTGLSAFQNSFDFNLPATNYVQMIQKMSDDSFWIGTFNNGLYVFNGTESFNFRVNDDYNSIPYNDVRDVVALPDGQYLLATWGGGLSLFDFESQTFGQVKNLKSDSAQIIPINVVTLEEDKDDVWIGTFGEGLFTMNKTTKLLTRNPSRLKNIISLKRSENHLWVGTWGNGLHKLDLQSDSIQPVVTEDITSNETIVSILDDGHDGLWLATKRGINHLNSEHQSEAISELRGEYHINSSFRSDGGTLYFGSTRGVISFDNGILEIESLLPKVLIENVALFSVPISDTSSYYTNEGLRLPHDQNTLTFDYAVLLYPNAGSISYQIKLDPSTSDWVDMGNQRSATFANLTDGEYTFQVKTDIQNSDVSSIDFVILKPWWKTGWALASFTLLFVILLYLYQRYAASVEKLRGNLRIEQLSREKELEINRIKQKFFINISHEIRTPLTLILGELEGVSERIIGDKSMQSSITKVKSNVNHMAHLVNELLDFRKLESGKVKLKVSEGNFVRFAKEIFLSFKNQAETKGIAYSFRTSQDEISLWYDRDESEKVLYNLLSNAFKYTPSGHSIHIELSHDEQFVYVKVIDTGKGIAKEQLASIFDRFYQSDNAQKVEGFGIGLSIVKEIIALHGGELGVESTKGKGSTFTVKLRKGSGHFDTSFLLEEKPDSEEVARYTTEETLNQEILIANQETLIQIVEDNEGIRDFIKASFSGEYRTVVASNGQEAIEQMKNELPDLIITDVMMPVMDGITFLSKVKSDRITSHIPIIVLTARTGLIFKKEGFDMGADDYVTKPFNKLLLQTRVKNILQNKERLRTKIRNEFITKPKELDINSPDEKFLSELSDLVEQNLNNPELGAEYLASQMGMSHSVIYKKLKALTGLKIVEFVRDYRLTQAASLLTDKGFSVAEACYKVGFNDRKYFSQIFKKKFGLTPTDYVKNHTEKS
ncbi:MAG: response regulator [Cyclobacteriaceae bacterium]